MCSGLIRLVNVQYQVSVACCEWLGGAGWCPCGGTAPEWDAVARCFTTPRPPSGPQRRWSEAVPHTAPDHAGLRRWSVPWKLALPTSGSADKSRSTTPGDLWSLFRSSDRYLTSLPSGIIISNESLYTINFNTHIKNLSFVLTKTNLDKTRSRLFNQTESITFLAFFTWTLRCSWEDNFHINTSTKYLFI